MQGFCFSGTVNRVLGVVTGLESVLSYGPRFKRIEDFSGEISETHRRHRCGCPAWNGDRCDRRTHRKPDKSHVEIIGGYERIKPNVDQTMY